MYEIWLVDSWDHGTEEPTGSAQLLARVRTLAGARQCAQLLATEYDGGEVAVLDAQAGRDQGRNVLVGLMQVALFNEAA